MIQIFEWLDLVRRGYKFEIILGISHRFDPDYQGYLIVFYHRPQLIWFAPSKPEIINTDEIPF